MRIFLKNGPKLVENAEEQFLLEKEIQTITEQNLHEIFKLEFKLLFPIEKNSKLKSIYDHFLAIKDNYRNPLSHGLLNEDAYLIPFAGKLIPYSYRNLNKVYHRFFFIETQEAEYILSLFNQFLTFIESNDPYKRYMYFIKYGFPIPAKKEEIDTLKKKMTDFEAFKEYIDSEVRYHDLMQ